VEKIEIGDGQTYIFSVGGTAELHSGVIYEVKDCDAEYPINKHSIVELPPSFAVPTTSLIPDVLNTLASFDNIGAKASWILIATMSGRHIFSHSRPRLFPAL